MKTKTKAKSAAQSTSSRPACKSSPKPNTKIAKVIALLVRKQGATLEEMTGATGWQVHSVRAALTGLKKKGHEIAKSKRDDVTCYRIEGQA